MPRPAGMVVVTDAGLELHHGDCRAILPTLPADSVHCVVTSPPYWGLRDYGTASWEGGDAACDHKRLSYPADRETPGGRGGSMPMSEVPYRETCGKCGAVRIDSQLGLESTPEEYVSKMVEVFRGVRRVLRDDGTVWLNMGDSYASGGKSGEGELKTSSGLNHGRGLKPGQAGWDNLRRAPRPETLKPKNPGGSPR